MGALTTLLGVLTTYLLGFSAQKRKAKKELSQLLKMTSTEIDHLTDYLEDENYIRLDPLESSCLSIIKQKGVLGDINTQLAKELMMFYSRCQKIDQHIALRLEMVKAAAIQGFNLSADDVDAFQKQKKQALDSGRKCLQMISERP